MEEVVKPARRGGKRVLAPPSPASTVGIQENDDVDDDDDDAEEGEPDVKPSVKARGGRKGKTSVPVVDEQPEEEEAAEGQDDTADLSDDSGDSVPIMKTPAKSKSKSKNRAPIVEDSPEPAVARAVEPSSTADTEGEQLATPAPSSGNHSDDDLAADLLSGTPRAPKLDAAAEDNNRDESAPDVKSEAEAAAAARAPTPAVNVAPTAYDLAAAARAAAVNHAAMEKTREKEREGKPRLVIHQLVLEDFKSYRGRGIIGPFHKVSAR